MDFHRTVLRAAMLIASYSVSSQITIGLTELAMHLRSILSLWLHLR
jgi:hypothetical protein